ncbi:MAG: hypothetical protein IKV65_01280, partial [Erysipelotrichaceae bacterium]|nr:hypothetical protein [Erysipelotrichaceae bacterium]
HIIKKYYSNYSDQDDLVSIGTIGLIKGINSYNPEKCTRLANIQSHDEGILQGLYRNHVSSVVCAVFRSEGFRRVLYAQSDQC